MNGDLIDKKHVKEMALRFASRSSVASTEVKAKGVNNAGGGASKRRVSA